MPENAIYVGRPTKWDNPFVCHSDRGPSGRRWPMTPQVAVAAFRQMLSKERAWYGQHHHYSRKYMPLYIAEACYKYSRRTGGRAG